MCGPLRNQRNTTPEAGVTTAQRTTVWEGRTTESLLHSGRNVIWLKRHTHDLPPRSSIPSSTTGKAELCSPVHTKHLTTFCAKNGQSFIHSQGRIHITVKMTQQLYTSAWMDPIKQWEVTKLKRKRIQGLMLARKTTLLVPLELY